MEWITVPVLTKGRFGQLIKDVEINPVKFPDKHIRQIKQNYGHAPYFDIYFEEFSEILVKGSKDFSLCNLDITLIRWLCSKLSISTRFLRASEFKATGIRSTLLINILKELGVDMYLSPFGSLEYLKEDHDFFVESDIAVFLQNYDHPEYNQVYTPFVPYASVTDLLFNEADKSLGIIHSGRRKPLRIEEFFK